jgi:hypothetical protein
MPTYNRIEVTQDFKEVNDLGRHISFSKSDDDERKRHYQYCVFEHLAAFVQPRYQIDLAIGTKFLFCRQHGVTLSASSHDLAWPAQIRILPVHPTHACSGPPSHRST